ncbi:MAG: 2-amino-4-hydroxy-6-hydroxymethyldihydropteridine diphosphokinase [Lentimicrobium sp.]|nr:2-amino-4-hydroxy-6-hydroxymethyldihydropteridine diphosphokinase [Lentimicrobium sp.]
MKDLYLILGSNLGDRLVNLKLAIDLIISEIGAIELASGLYETEPWGNSNQEMFLNQVVKLRSTMVPADLLEKILMLEHKLGRMRNGAPNSARTIDIDILFYGNMVVKSESLIIPHPRLHLRKFVLIPLNEISPEFIHPVLGESIGHLLKVCPDKLDVRIYDPVLNSGYAL